MTLILGIDPGKTGALAWLNQKTGELNHIEDMPRLDGAALGATLRDLLVEHPAVVAWVEKIGYMPGQQGRATFSQHYGTILGALGAWDIPVRHVAASKWKRAAGLTKRKGETRTQTKTRSRQAAIELFPSWSNSFSRAKDDGRAEAALIALHGFRGQP